MADLISRLLRYVPIHDADSDADLLGRFIAARDGQAFAELVQRYGPMVLAVCQRVLRHQQDAEDAFQATFLVLAQQAEAVEPRSLLGNWLSGVAYRTALAARRVTLARRTRETKAAVQRAENSVDEYDVLPELREILDRKLATLPVTYRAAVVACDLEGLTQHQAATRLGWPAGTRSSRLARGRALLARRLSRYGLAIPAAGLATVAGPAVVAGRLSETTIHLGLLVASGGVSIPASVATLMEGTMRTMLLTKFKVLAVAAVVGCAVAVTAVAGWRAEAVGAADPPEVTETSKRAVNPEKERITKLEQERDRLQKELSELKLRCHKLERLYHHSFVELNELHAIASPDRKSTSSSVPVQTKAVVRMYSVDSLVGNEKEGEALVKVVRAVVDPQSWGKDAGVEYLPARKVLVVRQTERIHSEVAELLTLLQKQGSQQTPPPGGR